MPRWLYYSFIALLAVIALLSATSLDEGEPANNEPPWSRSALGEVMDLLGEADSEVTDNQIHLRGVARSSPEWTRAFDELRASLSRDVKLVVDVYVIDETISMADLCGRMFDEVNRETIEFRKSGAELRSSSHAVLDRLAEFAADCPDAALAITGHTDSTGPEWSNRALSVARAQTVADYLVDHGTNPDRLHVSGVGSTQPVADNGTARGRERNRRIEIDLKAD